MIKKTLIALGVAAAFNTLVAANPSIQPQVEKDDRILGGKLLNPADYPEFVGLFTYRGVGDNDNVNCGGVLISPTWVLTASHCVRQLGNPFQAQEVVLGFIPNRIYIDGLPYDNFDFVGKYVDVENSHAGRDEGIGDIGLVHLTQPIPYPFGEYARLPELWDTAEPQGTLLSIGRGMTIETMDGSSVANRPLRGLRQTVEEGSNCSGDEHHSNYVPGYMLCMKSTSFHMNADIGQNSGDGYYTQTYHGDSGSPLYDQEGRVVGVASGAVEDNNNNQLTGYTLFASTKFELHRQWIYDITGL